MKERLLAMRLLEPVEHLRVGLDYHLARHNVLAANLAQVDTPGFRPLDLVRNEEFSAALSTEMAATQAGHIGAAGASSIPGTVMVDPNAPVGLDGNGVSLEREAVKIATNQLRYDVLTNLTTSTLGDLIWAANDGRGA